jgi:hypothetical protein
VYKSFFFYFKKVETCLKYPDFFYLYSCFTMYVSLLRFPWIKDAADEIRIWHNLKFVTPSASVSLDGREKKASLEKQTKQKETWSTFSKANILTLKSLKQTRLKASNQGDQMSLWKKSPKMYPSPFFAKIKT